MDPVEDARIAQHLERIIHRIKATMNYRGSYSTRDILGSLVARWVHSGEWERLKALPAEQRHLGQSVRRFILDRLDQLAGRGEQVELAELALPDEPALVEMVELAELRTWVAERVVALEAGQVDPRVRIPPARPTEVGQVLRRHLDGQTQREIAVALGISLGLVNKRLDEATRYLVLVRSVDQGLCE